MNFTDLPDLPTIWKSYIEKYKILNVQGDDFSKMGIFARNTVRNSIVFRATTNSIEKNTTKKQNTRHYALKIKVSDVCWIGGDGRSWTDVLLGCQKTFYILSLSFFLTSVTRVNTLHEPQKAE